ncbi:MAG TPA: HAD family phosphatase [Candidatus Manganitrophaceae bacterium]|nr:HAD family phosphatase [Candidatus Manganitrophaceae bacterium]
MLKAIIFDCDGVIVDSEPHHMKAFQQVLAEEGITLTEEEYFAKYLAMDDKGCFETALAAHQRPVDKTILKKLIIRKMALYRALSQQELFLYPGVVDFVKRAQGLYRLAIASGAFRGEIKFALDKGGMRSAFPVIVSAQDVRNGKPHPEAFLTALAKLNELPPVPNPPIAPSECVVIEDSLHGVEAARMAGMKCLAVTNSYSKEALNGKADRIVGSLADVDPQKLEKLFQA